MDYLEINYCRKCGKNIAHLDSAASHCPYCGAASTLSRIKEELGRAKGFADRTDAASKGGFLKWLRGVGLAEIAVKIASWAWIGIKRFFGF
jgi:predicted RNA-binding Zn-ribbon protein involved in translation (DUF1610 family)